MAASVHGVDPGVACDSFWQTDRIVSRDLILESISMMRRT
jgi:hypothetical protein